MFDKMFVNMQKQAGPHAATGLEGEDQERLSVDNVANN